MQQSVIFWWENDPITEPQFKIGEPQIIKINSQSLEDTQVGYTSQKSTLGKVQKNKKKKKLTNISFMYVCVAGNGEMLVYFSFFPNNSLNGQLSYRI